MREERNLLRPYGEPSSWQRQFGEAVFSPLPPKGFRKIADDLGNLIAKSPTVLAI